MVATEYSCSLLMVTVQYEVEVELFVEECAYLIGTNLNMNKKMNSRNQRMGHIVQKSKIPPFFIPKDWIAPTGSPIVKSNILLQIAH